MAQKRSEKPRTRREERRARAGADETSEAAERSESDEDEDEDEAPSEPGADAAEDRDDDDDGDEPDASEGGAEPAAAGPPANRAARRAQKAQSRTASAEDRRDAIRDRNRRSREEAAERRRTQRSAPAEEAMGGLDASERVDDALARLTFRTSRWIRQNSALVQSVLVLSFVGLIGWTVYRYFHTQGVGKRSDEFYLAIERMGATVGEPLEVLNPEGSMDPRPTFADHKERLTQATSAYVKASTVAAGYPLGGMAELGHAGALLEAGELDAAREKFEAVKTGSLAAKNAEVRGRALEGIGLALEAKGDLDAALKSYQQLENLGEDRFARLALYHRARVHHLKQEDKTAKDLLTDLLKRLGEPTSPENPGYLRGAAQELMLAVDPNATLPGMGALGGGLDAAGGDVEAMQRQLEELIRQAQAPSGPASGAPAPEPGAPEPGAPDLGGPVIPLGEPAPMPAPASSP